MRKRNRKRISLSIEKEHEVIIEAFNLIGVPHYHEFRSGSDQHIGPSALNIK